MQALKPSANLSKFNGGLHLPTHHEEATKQPISKLNIPSKLVLPIQQHIGEQAEPCVSTGDYVLKGQVIANANSYISAPIHAPTSGNIEHIGEQAVPHPSGLQATCITIKPDGEDKWIEKPVKLDYKSIDAISLRNRIREAGIVGLGGAAFPSAVKLNPGPHRTVHTLLINGAECEPYICCDDMLMRERADEIISGIEIIKYCLNVEKCIIATEDSKPEAHAALIKAIEQAGASDIEVIVIPTIYPTGGEKQLIKVVTGKEVPSNSLPADIGIVCHNAGTVAAIHRAIILGEPLISRIVTVNGKGIQQPQNVEVLFGTPINELIEFCGGYTNDIQRLIMGGPMMGFALFNDDLPVVKAANCILAASTEDIAEPGEPKACIRCGMCEQACPVNLLPQQLYWYSKAKEFEKTQEYNLFDCIECGVCSYVCPSNIPLVQYYRYAKTEIWHEEREHEKSDIARQRFEFRNERLEREKFEKAERLRKKKEALAKKQAGDDSKQAAIQAALERVKAKKETSSTENS